MVAFRSATVHEIIEERPGLQKVSVVIGDDVARAYVLTQVIGRVEVGDAVVCNTTAVDLDLGTGGWHFVHWNLARADFHQPGPGHIMKLRYTSLQVDTGCTEESEPALGGVVDAGGLTVVAASLHSQVAAASVAARDCRPELRIAYVMTDGAALPLALSDLVHRLRGLGLIDTTITCGHAFGGDREAVSLASALVIARHVERADLAIVAMGPGIVGTATPLGTTATELATVVDTAAALGADPIVAVRASDADPRARHRGVSHHTITALSLAARTATIAVPAHRGDVHDLLSSHATIAHHRLASVATGDIAARFEELGLDVRSMGRRAVDDRVLHECAAAAGMLAAGF